MNHLYVNQLSVLLVIETPRLQSRVAQTLSSSGHKVEISSDYTEAIQRLSHWIPQVIVVESALPGTGGFTLASVIRRNNYRAIHNDGMLRAVGIISLVNDSIRATIETPESQARELGIRYICTPTISRWESKFDGELLEFVGLCRSNGRRLAISA